LHGFTKEKSKRKKKATGWKGSGEKRNGAIKIGGKGDREEKEDLSHVKKLGDSIKIDRCCPQ
jgi:hypothetical protein